MAQRLKLVPEGLYNKLMNLDGVEDFTKLKDDKRAILKKRIPDDVKALLYQDALRRYYARSVLERKKPILVKTVNEIRKKSPFTSREASPKSDDDDLQQDADDEIDLDEAVESYGDVRKDKRLPPVPDDEPDLEYPPPPADGSDSEFEVEPQRRKRKAPPILNKRAMRHRQARHEEARQIPYFQRMREEDELLRTIEAGVKRRGDFTNEVRSKRRKLRRRRSVIKPSLNSMETDSSRGKRSVASNEGVVPKRRGIVLSYAKAARNRNLRWTPNAEQKWEEFENDPDNLF